MRVISCDGMYPQVLQAIMERHKASVLDRKCPAPAGVRD